MATQPTPFARSDLDFNPGEDEFGHFVYDEAITSPRYREDKRKGKDRDRTREARASTNAFRERGYRDKGKLKGKKNRELREALARVDRGVDGSKKERLYQNQFKGCGRSKKMSYVPLAERQQKKPAPVAPQPNRAVQPENEADAYVQDDKLICLLGTGPVRGNSQMHRNRKASKASRDRRRRDAEGVPRTNSAPPTVPASQSTPKVSIELCPHRKTTLSGDSPFCIHYQVGSRFVRNCKVCGTVLRPVKGGCDEYAHDDGLDWAPEMEAPLKVQVTCRANTDRSHRSDLDEFCKGMTVEDCQRSAEPQHVVAKLEPVIQSPAPAPVPAPTAEPVAVVAAPQQASPAPAPRQAESIIPVQPPVAQSSSGSPAAPGAGPAPQAPVAASPRPEGPAAPPAAPAQPAPRTNPTLPTLSGVVLSDDDAAEALRLRWGDVQMVGSRADVHQFTGDDRPIVDRMVPIVAASTEEVTVKGVCRNVFHPYAQPALNKVVLQVFDCLRLLRIISAFVFPLLFTTPFSLATIFFLGAAAFRCWAREGFRRWGLLWMVVSLYFGCSCWFTFMICFVFWCPLWLINDLAKHEYSFIYSPHLVTCCLLDGYLPEDGPNSIARISSRIRRCANYPLRQREALQIIQGTNLAARVLSLGGGFQVGAARVTREHACTQSDIALKSVGFRTLNLAWPEYLLPSAYAKDILAALDFLDTAACVPLRQWLGDSYRQYTNALTEEKDALFMFIPLIFMGAYATGVETYRALISSRCYALAAVSTSLSLYLMPYHLGLPAAFVPEIIGAFLLVTFLGMLLYRLIDMMLSPSSEDLPSASAATSLHQTSSLFFDSDDSLIVGFQPT